MAILMKTATCNNCHHSFQALESATLPTCPRCGRPVLLADEVYVPLAALEKAEKERKKRK